MTPPYVDIASCVDDSPAAEVGVTLPPGERMPGNDADIDACLALAGGDRLDCWERLDRKVSETIVPYIPYFDATRSG